jgi:hypothetical protein
MAMQIDQALLPTLRSRGATLSSIFNVRPNWRLQPAQISTKLLYVYISSQKSVPIDSMING